MPTFGYHVCSRLFSSVFEVVVDHCVDIDVGVEAEVCSDRGNEPLRPAVDDALQAGIRRDPDVSGRPSPLEMSTADRESRRYR